MNYKILMAVIACFILSCDKKHNYPKSGEFTVLTYNVAGLPQGINADQHPLIHTDSIGVLINEYDIVHVQEDFCYHDKLLAHNKHPYVTETKGCVPFGDGLNTFSNYFINNLKRFKWNQCNGTDCLTPKGFSYSQIVINPDVVIDFYNVHCNAGSTAADLTARRNNIVQLANYINKNSQGNAVIIMGDMNSRYTREGDTLELLVNMGFTDVWVQLMKNGEYPLPGTPALTNCTPSKVSPYCEVVDHILYRSSESIQLNATEYKLDDSRYYDATGDPLSDHNPMFAKFRYKRK
ncbi:MAG: endonuclease/exonuclease/phosphatase family protein [Chitinophagales bacterium]